MIKIEHEVFPSSEQMIFVIEGTRNAHNSWDKSDSKPSYSMGGYFLGENDEVLMTKLSKAGTDHRKFMRAMPVMCRITAPLYFWKEFDTYKVGTVSLSCSTMHTIESRRLNVFDFSMDSFEDYEADILIKTINQINFLIGQYKDVDNKSDIHRKIVQLLPDSYHQTRNICMNYEVLRNIYYARRSHKLDEWRELCKWVEEIPYAFLITGKE